MKTRAKHLTFSAAADDARVAAAEIGVEAVVARQREGWVVLIPGESKDGPHRGKTALDAAREAERDVLNHRRSHLEVCRMYVLAAEEGFEEAQQWLLKELGHVPKVASLHKAAPIWAADAYGEGTQGSSPSHREEFYDGYRDDQEDA